MTTQIDNGDLLQVEGCKIGLHPRWRNGSGRCAPCHWPESSLAARPSTQSLGRPDMDTAPRATTHWPRRGHRTALYRCGSPRHRPHAEPHSAQLADPRRTKRPARGVALHQSPCGGHFGHRAGQILQRDIRPVYLAQSSVEADRRSLDRPARLLPWTGPSPLAAGCSDIPLLSFRSVLICFPVPAKGTGSASLGTTL